MGSKLSPVSHPRAVLTISNEHSKYAYFGTSRGRSRRDCVHGHTAEWGLEHRRPSDVGRQIVYWRAREISRSSVNATRSLSLAWENDTRSIPTAAAG